MKRPLVTVCIPLYNTSKYIEETVRSLIDQDYPEYEVIVIDNASTDGSGELVKNMRSKRLSVIRFEKNVHSCENWSRAFALGKGEYVTVFHSDDIYEKGMVSRGAEFLDKNPDCVAVFTSAIMILGSGKEIGEINRPPQFSTGKIDAKGLIDFCIKQGYFPLICPTFMVRRNVAKKCGDFDCSFRFAFDMDYYMRLLEHGKIGFLGEKLIRYRQYPLQGSVRLHTNDTQAEFFQIVERGIKRWGVSLDKKDGERFDAYRRWGKVFDAIGHQLIGSRETSFALTKGAFRPADALIDFPSPKFIGRFFFTFAFLVSQYLRIGKPFASVAFWYRVRKRR